LTADSAVVTAWSNDAGYDDVFARQVEALGRPGDVLIGLSTSGRSRNVVRAFEAAERTSVRRIALLGGDGGDVPPRAEITLTVPSSDTKHIQEVHAVLVHLLCDLAERRVMAGRAEPRRDAAVVRALRQTDDERERRRARAA
jgi:D-inositol-3-phosphate glycosyltransferase